MATGSSAGKSDPRSGERKTAESSEEQARLAAYRRKIEKPERKIRTMESGTPATGSSGEKDAAASEEPRGEGRIIDLGLKFRSEEERRAWEESRRQRWEARIARENQAAVDLLRKEVGLQDWQAKELKRILDEAAQRRADLIDGLMRGEVSQMEMKSRVEQIREESMGQVKQVLSPEQFSRYLTLEPRKQVLRDDLKKP